MLPVQVVIPRRRAPVAIRQNSKMTIVDETTKTNRRASTYNTYDQHDVEGIYERFGESDHLLAGSNRLTKDSARFFRHMSPRLIPSDFEDEDDGETMDHKNKNNGNDNENGNDNDNDNGINNQDPSHSARHHRGFRRRLFLFLTEPSSSWLSAVFFFILTLAIFVSNVIIIMQTMSSFQYTPTECHFCGGDGRSVDMFDDDQTVTSGGSNAVECECPRRPYPRLEKHLGFILIFFAFEWTLRVISYVPAHPRSDIIGKCGDWLKFLASPQVLLDALAIWPYFIARYDLPGLVSLRLLRLLRVFQLLRLGTYNSMFVSLTRVLYKSIGFLELLVVILFFGATIFGSLLFW